MKIQWLRFWQSRAPKERRIIAYAGAILLVLSYVWLMQLGWTAHVRLRASVTELAAQAHRLAQQASEIERLRLSASPTASATDLRVIVQAQTNAAGLAQALVKLDAPDANQVMVVFGALPFKAWLDLLVGLQAQNVRLASCRIEALSAPGMVSLTATLQRTAQP
ncbi:hypothetical protein OYT1_ch1146 [Ferriphaselus amnicola]|uniref:General secretion pathway protein M n=1 Tax=Ferriphaselus amnicola TaxID=1188319 RepID=A0A2Z6GB80_9PROT|nr:type II secretion system protein GspM [Ferriphaselus amnicola]BBE50706.1 hypothetical protein OYT1_ch1146 [Ferriphaselus amnicola]